LILSDPKDVDKLGLLYEVARDTGEYHHFAMGAPCVQQGHMEWHHWLLKVCQRRRTHVINEPIPILGNNQTQKVLGGFPDLAAKEQVS
jgi:hypothetical protein